MIIIPAIDIMNGVPVRLYQGDYNQKTQVAQSVSETAQKFQEDGALWLHLVDLDGAKAGHPVNHNVIFQVIRSMKVNIEVGGGIRSMEEIDAYMAYGASRVILGTAALEDETLLRMALAKYGKRIAVGIDARNSLVSTAGWLKDSATDYLTFAKHLQELGVKTVIATDISRDGTLQGPSLKMYQTLIQNTGLNIIASGGISSMADLDQLNKLGVSGAVLGKSLYTGAISLRKAIEEA